MTDDAHFRASGCSSNKQPRLPATFDNFAAEPGSICDYIHS